MPGRLNIFQRAMLRWDDIYPYNSAHLVRLRVPLDLPRLREAIRRRLVELGLGEFCLSQNLRTYQWNSTVVEPEIVVVAPDQNPLNVLTAEIERQLNTRFMREQHLVPFRFLAAAAGAECFFGLVYFHPAADGEAVVHLLRNLVDAYLGAGQSPRPLQVHPRRHDQWYRQSPGLVARKFSSLGRLMQNMRKSRRVPHNAAKTGRNAITFFPLTQTEFTALAHAGKAWNVTINDLFLALLLKGVLRLAARQRPPARRPWISVGCIVNLRKDLDFDSSQTFGLFLGSFIITHRGSTELSLRELATSVRQETARIKRHRLYLGAPLELAFARWWLGFLSPERRARFYPKHFPLWGGISNMNLNPLWPGGSGGRVSDYFRAVSTGPITPLVLSLTSFGKVTNVGVSYRTEVYSSNDVVAVQQCFLETVRELPPPANHSATLVS